MYVKSETIPLKGSTAVLHNNLTILNIPKEKTTVYGVAGKNVFFLTKVDDSGVNPIFKQVTPQLIEKAGNDVQQVFNIVEAKFLKVGDRPILVILTTKTVFFYEDDTFNLIHAHNLGTRGTSSSEEMTYARGIAVIDSNIITIGTASGIILLFEVSGRGTSMSLKNDINDKNFQSGISALVSNPNDGLLCASDTTANVVIFAIKSTTNIKTQNAIKLDNPVTCMELYRNYVVCGLGNGTVSIYDVLDARKLIDIAAHGRWINSLHLKDNLLISTGEDCFFRIWELNEINDRLKVNHLQSERVIDNLICSAQFNKGTREVCVSSFDCNQILIYKLG